jgi:hypothetical protein
MSEGTDDCSVEMEETGETGTKTFLELHRIRIDCNLGCLEIFSTVIDSSLFCYLYLQTTHTTEDVYVFRFTCIHLDTTCPTLT